MARDFHNFAKVAKSGHTVLDRYNFIHLMQDMPQSPSHKQSFRSLRQSLSDEHFLWQVRGFPSGPSIGNSSLQSKLVVGTNFIDKLYKNFLHNAPFVRSTIFLASLRINLGSNVIKNYSSIDMYYNWLKLVTWFATATQSAILQHIVDKKCRTRIAHKVGLHIKQIVVKNVIYL